MRHRSPWYMYLWWNALARKDYDMDGFSYQVQYIGIANGKVIVEYHNWEQQRETLMKRIQQEPDFLYAQIQKAYIHHADLIHFCEELHAKQDLSSHTNNELAEIVDTYNKLTALCAPFSILPLYVEDDIAQEIHKRLKKQNPDCEKDFNTIMTPVKKGTVTLEQESILELAEQFKKNGERGITDALQQHIFNFSWMKNVGYFEEYFSKEYYLERINEESQGEPTKKLRDMRKEHGQHEQEFKRIMRQYQEDAYLVSLIETINEAIYYRSFRSEEFYKSARYLKKLFQEIAKRFQFEEYTDVLFLLLSEVIEHLKQDTKPTEEDIAERRHSYIYVTDYEDYIFYQGEEAEQIAAGIRVGDTDSDEITGQVAFPGKVQGRVVVVKGPDDFHKVQDGDILVAQSTQPNYVPIMKKSAAFVTEEGGVLCHTSVISREMEVPCIIGTSVATSALQDGDVVEVDADNGVVRKLDL